MIGWRNNRVMLDEAIPYARDINDSLIVSFDVTCSDAIRLHKLALNNDFGAIRFEGSKLLGK